MMTIRNDIKPLHRKFSDFLKGSWAFLSGGLLVIVYFCYFVLPSLNGRFREDDAYNIYYYWSRGFWKLIQGILIFFSTYYRPVGGAYYYSLYSIFGLNPVPYHAVIIALFLINVILVYRCATMLSQSRIVGFICAVLMSYHANMASLLYAPAFVYDVLCFTFYFAALFYYMRIRYSGRQLSKGQLFIFILLHIAALESKEMAVSLPVMIVIYEILWHTPELSAKSVQEWLRRQGLPALISVFITAGFIIGKSIGPEALSDTLAYRPIFTFGQFLESNAKFIKDIFYLDQAGRFYEKWLIFVWIILAYAAINRRHRQLAFSFAMIVIAPLPIAFIPGRGGATLYIPCFAWALVFATLIERICSYLSGKLLYRFINVTLAKAALLLFAIGLIWYQTELHRRKAEPAIGMIGHNFGILGDQLATLLPKVKPGSQIAFYNDIFPDFSAQYITELLYGDRSVNVRLHGKTPLLCSELNSMDYVLGFEQEKLVLLKRAGEVFRPPQSAECRDPDAVKIIVSRKPTEALIKAGQQAEVDFSGIASQPDLFWDIKYIAPGTSFEQIVLNWQKGMSIRHNMTASSSPENWIITGIRAHRDQWSHSDKFMPVNITLHLAP
jgi:hypothetical protein